MMGAIVELSLQTPLNALDTARAMISPSLILVSQGGLVPPSQHVIHQYVVTLRPRNNMAFERLIIGYSKHICFEGGSRPDFESTGGSLA